MLHREFGNHCCVFKATLMYLSLHLFRISSQSEPFLLNQQAKTCFSSWLSWSRQRFCPSGTWNCFKILEHLKSKHRLTPRSPCWSACVWAGGSGELHLTRAQQLLPIRITQEFRGGRAGKIIADPDAHSGLHYCDKVVCLSLLATSKFVFHKMLELNLI